MNQNNEGHHHYLNPINLVRSFDILVIHEEIQNRTRFYNHCCRYIYIPTRIVISEVE